jgi:hypothetical protein
MPDSFLPECREQEAYQSGLFHGREPGRLLRWLPVALVVVVETSCVPGSIPDRIENWPHQLRRVRLVGTSARNSFFSSSFPAGSVNL